MYSTAYSFPSKAPNCPCFSCLHLPVTGADTDASLLKRLCVWKPYSELFEAAATAWQCSSQIQLHFLPQCVVCVMGVVMGQTGAHSCLLAVIILYWRVLKYALIYFFSQLFIHCPDKWRNTGPLLAVVNSNVSSVTWAVIVFCLWWFSPRN